MKLNNIIVILYFSKVLLFYLFCILGWNQSIDPRCKEIRPNNRKISLLKTLVNTRSYFVSALYPIPKQF